MSSFKDRLKEILTRDQLISEKDLKRAFEEHDQSGKPLNRIFIDLDLIDENTLIEVLSESLGFPPINISRLTIEPEVIQAVSKDIVEKYQIMPVSLLGDHLTLAMSNPLDIFAIDNVKALTGYTINPVICNASEIKKSIRKYYQQEKPQGSPDTFDSIIKDMHHDPEEMEFIAHREEDARHSAIEELTEEAPIIRLTDTIIQQAVLAKASDVFIEPMEKTLRVRYRIDGVIREIDRMAKILHFPIVSRIKVISNLDISEHRLPQDGRFKTIIDGKHEVDFRVNVLPTAIGEKVVLRILDQNASALDLEKLGFEEKSLKRLKECIARPHGLILTCGPTGSGKTTTLYSALQHINSPGKNIVTVEDPVEFQMKGASQVNIKPSMGLTFSNSLRSILRQDPDIIMIGEIRDSETLDIAVKAALTGHLVLSSLHTTTAAGSVIRMMNMGIAPFLICSSVLAIVAQRLLRRVCDKCKESYVLSKAVVQKMGLEPLLAGKKAEFFKGKGCKHCFETGYAGRVGITEILILSPEIKDIILGRKGEIAIKTQARAEGMQTMREDGLNKAIEGLTTLEEVLRVTAADESMDKK